MIHLGDCLETMRGLPDGMAQTCVTSPPYFGLRDYGMPGQHGLEATPDAFVAGMVAVFREVRRLLRDDGTLWLNLGDSYASTAKGSGGTAASTLGTIGGRTGRSREGVQRSLARQSMGVRRFDLNAGAIKQKDLIGIPWRVAFALQADGWYLRQDIIWHKPNPMPESVRDRCTKAHEYLFLLTKAPRYYFDAQAIAEPSIYAPGTTAEVERDRGYYGGKWAEPSDGSRNDGAFKAIRETRNKRSVWSVATRPFAGAHFATFPPALIEPCILAGSRPGDVVFDPYLGAGTTAVVAERFGRRWAGCELNPDYAAIAQARIDEAVAQRLEAEAEAAARAAQADLFGVPA